MTAINLLDTGIVYRGSKDDPHLRNAAFPSIAQLPDGRLVATMTIGRERNSSDVRCYCSESPDSRASGASGGGDMSWSPPRKIFEPDESDHPVSAGIRMSRVQDGSLVGFANLLDRSDPQGAVTNPENGGSVAKEHAITRSIDGRTWTRPEFFEPPLDWNYLGEPSPVLAISADRWLLPSLTRLDWHGRCPFGLKSFVMISRDEGRTWPRAVDVFDLWARRIITWEQKQTRLTDGRLLAVTWAFDSRTRENLPNLYTFSYDEGESYDSPYTSPLRGQTCTPLALGHNHLLCVYRRLDKNGLWAHLAQVMGTDWIPHAETCLWGSDRAAMPGAKNSAIENQGALQFGFPQLIRLEEGNIFVVFWAVEDGLSVIRWFRLRVSCE